MTHATHATRETTYRGLIDAAHALFDAGAHATHDEDTELRAAIDKLLDPHRSTADPHDIDAIRMNANLL
jgi:hypothetical protein